MLVLACLLSAALPAGAQTQLSPSLSAKPRPRVVLADRIVAVVNDEVITRVELDERVDVVRRDFLRKNLPLPPADVLDSQVLERLIIDRAQLQVARENNITVDDVQLTRTVERIAEQNKMTLADFRNALEKDGIPYAKFRTDIRNEILITRVREREVERAVTCTDGEINDFIAQNNAGNAAQQQGEINLGHILVRVPENATAEQIEQRRKRAEEALAQLKAGTDFAKVSVSFSDAPEALKGGELGLRPEDRLPQLFVDAVGKLKNGETSQIVKSSNGFHILKVIERKSGGGPKIAVEQIHARHILIKTNELVSQDQARHRLEDLRQRLENKGDFAELARLYSNDGSASKGGDLGWVYPGDTVPEFEKAMNGLKIGEISQPVQTQFGWHLIQVLERRKDDMSPERVRGAACQAIKEKKSDDAYQEWLRQLRDRTFVELRLDDR
jgi:peptidyl-prolyl cis-trans isomerase SurA